MTMSVPKKTIGQCFEKHIGTFSSGEAVPGPEFGCSPADVVEIRGMRCRVNQIICGSPAWQLIHASWEICTFLYAMVYVYQGKEARLYSRIVSHHQRSHRVTSSAYISPGAPDITPTSLTKSRISHTSKVGPWPAFLPFSPLTVGLTHPMTFRSVDGVPEQSNH